MGSGRGRWRGGVRTIAADVAKMKSDIATLNLNVLELKSDVERNVAEMKAYTQSKIAQMGEKMDLLDRKLDKILSALRNP